MIRLVFFISLLFVFSCSKKSKCCGEGSYAYVIGVHSGGGNSAYSSVFLPNAFTPNADGVNDLFCAKGLNSSANYQLQVKDFWGTVIFETTDFAVAWNGKKNNSGDPVNDGTYKYHIKFDNYKGETIEHDGHVCIRRKNSTDEECSNCVYSDQIDAVLGVIYKTVESTSCK